MSTKRQRSASEAVAMDTRVEPYMTRASGA
jgi:hypothetical protein